MRTLLRVVVVVLVLELVILSVQYAVASAVGRKNPVRALYDFFFRQSQIFRTERKLTRGVHIEKRRSRCGRRCDSGFRFNR